MVTPQKKNMLPSGSLLIQGGISYSFIGRCFHYLSIYGGFPKGECITYPYTITVFHDPTSPLYIYIHY